MCAASRKYLELWDEQWLRHEYVDNSRTLSSIAKQLGCTVPTVCNAVARYGITGPTPIPELHDEQWLRCEYIDNGRTQADIAAQLGCVQNTVKLALRRLGIEARPPGPPVGHGHTRRDQRTPTYRSWQAMKNRCTNRNQVAWKSYGGRGITICDRWTDRNGFKNFLTDMGERPEGMTIDRIDVNGNYEPSNCQWATAKEQTANRR